MYHHFSIIQRPWIVVLPPRSTPRPSALQTALYRLSYSCCGNYPGGGRGWCWSIKFYTWRLRPEVGPTPYPFTYHFWLKRYPFPMPSFDKWHPFLITNLEFCIPFNQCKGTEFKIWINHKTRTFSRLFHSLRINLWALLGLFAYRNNRWPYTFTCFNQ